MSCGEKLAHSPHICGDCIIFSPHHYAHLCYFCGFSVTINLPPDSARILQLYSLAPITPSRPHVRLHNSRKWAAKLRKITKKNKFSEKNSAIFLIFAVFCCSYHRVGAFLITELAVFCSVIWRKVIWEDGRKYANFMLILTIWSKKCKKNLSNPKFFSTFANAKVFASKAQSVTGRTS